VAHRRLRADPGLAGHVGERDVSHRAALRQVSQRTEEPGFSGVGRRRCTRENP
jgi:hypothetical protein